MRVRDVMSERPFTIPEESSVEYAAGMMRDCRIGFIPVGEKENIVGIITDRDITTRVTAEAKDPKHTPVRDVMTHTAAYCFEDQDIEDACFMMEDKHIRRLLVFDRAHSLVGILSLDDVAVRARKDKLAGYALSKVAKTA
ncbi:MAG TPA: CBS domain-containing protein [Terriglobia bacterium]|nr:CBS domain-containing protein [Terriglobia bacterium]